MASRQSHILVAPPPARLSEAVARELSASAPAPGELAEAVRTYALEAYARLIPPERMLISLKAIVSEAPSEACSRTRAEFTAALIPFAIEGYYLDPWYRRTGATRKRGAARASRMTDSQPRDFAPPD